LGKFALRKTRALTFLALRRLLLSEIICPVFENSLSEGTDVATDSWPSAKPGVNRGSSCVEEEAPPGRLAPP